MTGARFAKRRCASSEILTANATNLVSLGPAVCNRHAREQKVPNVNNMVAKNPCEKPLVGRLCAPDNFPCRDQGGADQGYVRDPLIHDRVRKYRSTLKGDMAPPYSWKNENSLKYLADWN